MASEAELVKQVWSEAKTVAVVGATNKDTMPVYDVMKFLQAQVFSTFNSPPLLSSLRLLFSTPFP
eukprot:98702-Hanusia_phi.AAC.2